MNIVTIHIGKCSRYVFGMIQPAPIAKPSDQPLSRALILEAAKAEVRHHGEARTGVVDVARRLGVSHAALYRHFPSKAALMDAIVEEVMADEEAMARAHVDAGGAAAGRLEALLLDLHRRKRERLVGDRAMHDLHRRVVVERPEIVAAYADRMTALVARLLAQGVAQGEFAIGDVDEAAGVVRDAVTAFVHPALVVQDAGPGGATEARLRAVVATLLGGFAQDDCGQRQAASPGPVGNVPRL